MSKTDEYQCIVKEVMSCAECDLGCEKLLDGYNPHVVGQGNLDSKIVFIAEAPGFNETVHCRPLTPPGTSGKIYEKLLSKLGLSRDDVYTTNVVMCRPPKNRDPEPWEIHKCRKYLRRQLEVVGPEIVVTFGRFAAQYMLGNFGKITQEHGKIKRSDNFGVNVFPLYHPAYIGAYAPKSKREEFKQDVEKLKKILKGSDQI
jgi:DNA polymerase